MANEDHYRFLVIDDNADSRMLLTKTLMRKYPDAAVIECQHGDTAAKIVARELVSAVVAHRTFDYDGPRLIALLRQANAGVPIVAVSGHDAAAKTLAAGANAFLNYDAWLQIGTVVAKVIAAAPPASRVPAAPAAVVRLPAAPSARPAATAKATAKGSGR